MVKKRFKKVGTFYGKPIYRRVKKSGGLGSPFIKKKKK